MVLDMSSLYEAPKKKSRNFSRTKKALTGVGLAGVIAASSVIGSQNDSVNLGGQELSQTPHVTTTQPSRNRNDGPTQSQSNVTNVRDDCPRCYVPSCTNDERARTYDSVNVLDRDGNVLHKLRGLEIDRNRRGSLGERLLGDVSSWKVQNQENLPYSIGNFDIGGTLISAENLSSNSLAQNYFNSRRDCEPTTHDIIAIPEQTTQTVQRLQPSQRERVVEGTLPESSEMASSEETRGLVLFPHRNNTVVPYMITDQEGQLNGYRLLTINAENKITTSRNSEDILYDLSPEEIANLTFQVWSNPRVSQLMQPSRDAVLMQQRGIISNTSLDYLREGINGLEGRLCSENNTNSNCTSPRDMTNALAVAAVYDHAGRRSIEELAGLVETPWYGHLKGDNSNPGSWAISMILPGDDLIAQSLTHYTGNVLTGDQRSQFRGMVRECSQKPTAYEILNCVDNKTESIIDSAIQGGKQ